MNSYLVSWPRQPPDPASSLASPTEPHTSFTGWILEASLTNHLHICAALFLVCGDLCSSLAFTWKLSEVFRSLPVIGRNLAPWDMTSHNELKEVPSRQWRKFFLPLDSTAAAEQNPFKWPLVLLPHHHRRSRNAPPPRCTAGSWDWATRGRPRGKSGAGNDDVQRRHRFSSQWFIFFYEPVTVWDTRPQLLNHPSGPKPGDLVDPGESPYWLPFGTVQEDLLAAVAVDHSSSASGHRGALAVALYGSRGAPVLWGCSAADGSQQLQWTQQGGSREHDENLAGEGSGGGLQHVQHAYFRIPDICLLWVWRIQLNQAHRASITQHALHRHVSSLFQQHHEEGFLFTQPPGPSSVQRETVTSVQLVYLLFFCFLLQSDKRCGERDEGGASTTWRILLVCNCCGVTLSPSSGSPLSVADKGRRSGCDSASPTSSNYPGPYLSSTLFPAAQIHEALKK